MGVTPPTQAEHADVSQADVEAAEPVHEAPERSNQWIWILAGVLFIVAGAISVFTSDLEVLSVTGAPLSIILVGLGFLCFFIAGGFIRRPRTRREPQG